MAPKFAAFLFYLLVAVSAVDELKIEVLLKPENCERATKDGDLISVHYTGTLEKDGTQFDSSQERGHPFVFQLGKKQVIPGWDQGLLDMCKGEKRRLSIPPHLGYGDQGAGDKIPPNASLVFEVELTNVEDAPPPVNVFKQIDSDSDGQLSRDEVGGYLKKQIPPDMKPEDMAGFDQDKMVEEIFQHEDKDRNGYISHEEFSGPKHDEL